jgi:urease accessory protein
MLRAVAVTRASEIAAGRQSRSLFGKAVLQHDERHLRRRAIDLVDGRKILVDLPEPVVLQTGDVLVLDGGGYVDIAAAEEPLYEIFAKNPVHLTELTWHIGNRHLAAAIEANRVLILRDHVIKAMLEGLGATVNDIVAPFNPARGAYSGHGHDHHDHAHDDRHSHSHEDHGHEHHHDGQHHHD